MNYTKVANQVLEDATLSLKAKGLFAYLVKLPKDWKIRIVELAKHHKDSRDSIRTGIIELLEAGYLERLGRSRDKGQLKDYEYRINTDFQPRPEKPTLENPVQAKPTLENPVQVDSPLDQTEPDIAPRPEKPTLEKPTLEKPTLENPTLYIKDLQTNNTNTPLTPQGETTKPSKKSKKASAATLPPLPDWLPKDLWSDFVELRKAMRIPLTPGAIKRNVTKLTQIAEKYSVEHACFCLSETVANGWRGIPELEPHRARAATSQRFLSVEERNRIAAEKFLNGDSDGLEESDFGSAGDMERSYWQSLQRKNARRLV